MREKIETPGAIFRFAGEDQKDIRKIRLFDKAGSPTIVSQFNTAIADLSQKGVFSEVFEQVQKQSEKGDEKFWDFMSKRESGEEFAIEFICLGQVEKISLQGSSRGAKKYYDYHNKTPKFSPVIVGVEQDKPNQQHLRNLYNDCANQEEKGDIKPTIFFTQKKHWEQFSQIAKTPLKENQEEDKAKSFTDIFNKSVSEGDKKKSIINELNDGIDKLKKELGFYVYLPPIGFINFFSPELFVKLKHLEEHQTMLKDLQPKTEESSFLRQFFCCWNPENYDENEKLVTKKSESSEEVKEQKIVPEVQKKQYERKKEEQPNNQDNSKNLESKKKQGGKNLQPGNSESKPQSNKNPQKNGKKKHQMEVNINSKERERERERERESLAIWIMQNMLRKSRRHPIF
jgi:hypothetical protein